MEYKFQVGETVMIVDEVSDTEARRYDIVEEMFKYLGCDATIVSSEEWIDNRIIYYLDVDDRNFFWDENVLRRIEQEDLFEVSEDDLAAILWIN